MESVTDLEVLATEEDTYRESLSWIGLVIEINRFAETEPFVVEITERATGNVSRGRLVGAHLRGSHVIFESPEQFQETDGNWKSIGYVESSFSASYRSPLPIRLCDRSIEVATEDFDFKIYRYGTIECPPSSQR